MLRGVPTFFEQGLVGPWRAVCAKEHLQTVEPRRGACFHMEAWVRVALGEVEHVSGRQTIVVAAQEPRPQFSAGGAKRRGGACAFGGPADIIVAVLVILRACLERTRTQCTIASRKRLQLGVIAR